MKFHLKNTQIQVDLLMFLFPITAMMLGTLTETSALLLALFFHEAAHLLAAYMLRIGISSIRLMPFGGAIQMENPYAISAPRLLAVAAAGPLANLALIVCTAALCQWQRITPDLAVALLQSNSTLLLFNLLPALPLDGGRMLFALLSICMKREQALRVGLWSGRILATILILLALWGFLHHRQLNLSLVFMATFILGSSPDERRALSNRHIQTLLNRLSPRSAPIPADVVVVDAAASAQNALLSARPNRATLFAVYQSGQFTKFTDDRTLLNAILSMDGKITIERAIFADASEVATQQQPS